jgi:hypothetical protein
MVIPPAHNLKLLSNKIYFKPGSAMTNRIVAWIGS